MLAGNDKQINEKGTLKATEHEKYENIALLGLIEPVHGQ
jgi:hypothetical protein